jgi:hypothetical protein
MKREKDFCLMCGVRRFVKFFIAIKCVEGRIERAAVCVYCAPALPEVAT